MEKEFVVVVIFLVFCACGNKNNQGAKEQCVVEEIFL